MILQQNPILSIKANKLNPKQAWQAVDKILQKTSSKWIAGVDEAGRGSWAGPLAVAMVIRSTEKILKEREGKDNFIIRDSKKLTLKNREFFFTEIKKYADWTFVAFADLNEIEVNNINGATELAIKKILKKLPWKFKNNLTLFIDGRFKFKLNIGYINVEQGDTRLGVIAEASILAKVSRDRLMLEFDRKYAGYGFREHKGYGTSFHRKQLEKLGISKIHRKKYKPIADILNQRSGRPL